MNAIGRKARAPKPRILVAAHAHPALSNGGGEIAAYQLYQALLARGDAWFLGCDRDGKADKPGSVFFQPFPDAREYLYATDEFDWFKFANRDQRFPAAFRALLAELRPDIVHFHHHINFGVEAFQHVRDMLPDAKIVLTLHEYLAICHHYGQMVTKTHFSLCRRASPSDCHKCFPEYGKADFFLRKLYIERFFALVDRFIAPSRFLAGRYAEWGIPEEKIAVLENMMPETARGAIAPPPVDGPLRIGFFGQISPLKGSGVVFDAAEMLAGQDDVSFEIFGDYSGQMPEFQKSFLDRLKTAGPNIRFNGPYDRSRVDRLMQSVHAVLVPSIWWENSPVVIQEALRNRRPVICSDIGGMAEKVRDGVDGFHFTAGNAVSLAALVRRLAGDRAGLAALTEDLPGEPALVTGLDEYMALYQALV